MAETTYYVDTDVSGGTGDGSSWANAYSSLNAAENARDADITGGNAVRFLCRGSTNADTAAVTVQGWTTDSDSYVSIVADSEDRHAGVWSDSKYRLVVSDAIGITIVEDYVRVDGLQIKVINPTANARYCINYQSISVTNNEIWISNNILVGHGHATFTQDGINGNDNDAIVHSWNNIIYGIGSPAGSRCILANGAIFNIYSSTVIGGQHGIRNGTGTINVKNTFAGGSSAEDFLWGSGTLNKVNCASEDGSADDTGANETATNCDINIAIDTDTFVNVTGGSEDFHLAADGASPLVDQGVDTSGEGAPLNFTTDIVGATRTGTWEIGAFIFTAVGGAGKGTSIIGVVQMGSLRGSSGSGAGSNLPRDDTIIQKRRLSED